tara:strand:+ start:1188 stop:3125 length:1938 start_codon:yes stop_codon:yes gene_type:complete
MTDDPDDKPVEKKGLGFGLCCCNPCEDKKPGGFVPHYFTPEPLWQGHQRDSYWKLEIPTFEYNPWHRDWKDQEFQYINNDFGGVTVKPSSPKAKLVWEFDNNYYYLSGGGVFGEFDYNVDWNQNLSRLFFDFETNQMTWELDGTRCTWNWQPLPWGHQYGFYIEKPDFTRDIPDENRSQLVWSTYDFELDEDGALKIDWCRRWDHFALYLNGDPVGLFPLDYRPITGQTELRLGKAWLGTECFNYDQWVADGRWTVEWYNYRQHGTESKRVHWFDECNSFEATSCEPKTNADTGYPEPSRLYKVIDGGPQKNPIQKVKIKFSGFGSERFFSIRPWNGWVWYDSPGFSVEHFNGKEITLSLQDYPYWPQGYDNQFRNTHFQTDEAHGYTNSYFGIAGTAQGGTLPHNIDLFHDLRNVDRFLLYGGFGIENTHPPASGGPLDFYNNRHEVKSPPAQVRPLHNPQVTHSLYSPGPVVQTAGGMFGGNIDRSGLHPADPLWSDWIEWVHNPAWSGAATNRGRARTGIYQIGLSVDGGGMVRLTWILINENGIEYVPSWGDPYWVYYQEYYAMTHFWQVEGLDDFILVDAQAGVNSMQLAPSGILPDPHIFSGSDGCFASADPVDHPGNFQKMIDSLATINNSIVTVTEA